MLSAERIDDRINVLISGDEAEAEILYLIHTFRNEYLEDLKYNSEGIATMRKCILDVFDGKAPDQVMKETIDGIEAEDDDTDELVRDLQQSRPMLDSVIADTIAQAMMEWKARNPDG